MKVYLAGGYKTNWQEKFKELTNGKFEIYNPREKEFNNNERVVMDLTEYGAWDLHHIRMSDVVFVYLEKTNPSCIGAVIEARYAKGLGKTVVTVLEKEHEFIEDRYLEFIKKVSDITYDNFKDGVEFVKSIKN